ncbi:SOS response associated peptidase (SRAP) domain-containing protein [Hirsutella rhossiliensis]|uniref:SOS response associated peptidase (SRAP) domain-containing protein n=1 Tax=Hirsutella rhossiliensis TaxID=111463 RepID=A0A9P8MYP8_9HYPO|nr:SOS response associated peptidase (SRAP) domain-containing protein [Hirsutella rhossiliensis]KAH0963730.1 SOS response associated peptidase (SRAP) domain-containing protein [Hirsutella rhossiliensis]
MCGRYALTLEKTYRYTIITTDSNKQLKFLYNRMPVIRDPGSDAARTWLDSARREWTRDLQCLLRPFDSALDVYPVSKDVGKVGNNSPSFIIPLDNKENKTNIAKFFAGAPQKKQAAARLEQAEKPSTAAGADGPSNGDAKDFSTGKRKAAPLPGGSPPLK